MERDWFLCECKMRFRSVVNQTRYTRRCPKCSQRVSDSQLAPMERWSNKGYHRRLAIAPAGTPMSAIYTKSRI